jgi:hypothetical protein
MAKPPLERGYQIVHFGGKQNDPQGKQNERGDTAGSVADCEC